jgi:hypothetical protein
MNYDVKLKAIRLVHQWYDDCPTPVVMSSECLNLLLERIEEELAAVPDAPKPLL